MGAIDQCECDYLNYIDPMYSKMTRSGKFVSHTIDDNHDSQRLSHFPKRVDLVCTRIYLLSFLSAENYCEAGQNSVFFSSKFVPWRYAQVPIQFSNAPLFTNSAVQSAIHFTTTDDKITLSWCASRHVQYKADATWHTKYSKHVWFLSQ